MSPVKEPKDFVFSLDNIPHDWLFLQCAAVVSNLTQFHCRQLLNSIFCKGIQSFGYYIMLMQYCILLGHLNLYVPLKETSGDSEKFCWPMFYMGVK